MQLIYPFKQSDFRKEHLSKVLELTNITGGVLTLLIIEHQGQSDAPSSQKLKNEVLQFLDVYLKIKKAILPMPITIKKEFQKGDFTEQLNNCLQSIKYDLLITSHRELNEFRAVLSKNKYINILPLFP